MCEKLTEFSSYSVKKFVMHIKITMTVIGVFVCLFVFWSKSLKDIWRTREQNRSKIPGLKCSHYLTSPYISSQTPFSMLSCVAMHGKGLISQILLGWVESWYSGRGVKFKLLQLRRCFYYLYFPILTNNCCYQNPSTALHLTAMELSHIWVQKPEGTSHTNQGSGQIQCRMLEENRMPSEYNF